MHRNCQQSEKGCIDIDNRLLVQYASMNNILLVHDAIDNGADVNLLWHGQNALFFAAQHCNLEMLKLLLQAGANPSAANKDGLTPLHKACEKGSYDIVQLLLDAGSDVNVNSKYGRTPLLYAVQYGNNLALILLLLKYKAHINAVGRSLGAFTERNCTIEQWCTPLGQASKRGRSDYIIALVEAGARLTDVLIMVNVASKERKSFTAFDVSLGHSDVNVLSYLIKNGAAIKPVCYNGSYLVWSEASCSVMTALQVCHLSETFVGKILLLLTQTGFTIQKDSYCKDLIERYRQKSKHENKKSDKDLFLEIFTESSFSKCSNASYKLFATTNCTDFEIGRSKTVQHLIENSFNVNTLVCMCRIRIRNRLSLVNHRRALSPLIERLPLPSQLMQFLMLEC